MKEIKQNSLHAWLLAARPKTLTGAIIPVLVGTSLAFTNDSFKPLPALLCFLFACGMQVAANFINDLFDYLKGSDRNDRLGPERACTQGWITPTAMKRGIAVVIVMACVIGLGLLYTCWGALPHGGWELVVLGVFCIIFAFLYTTILSYQGWGDLLVLVFFGFVPVGGTYYVQAYTVTPDVVVASIICGLVIDTLLVVNNYRDRKQDALSGKQTLIVRLGEPFGRYCYLWLGIIAALLSFWFVKEWNVVSMILPVIYFYAHIRAWWRMSKIRSGKKLNNILAETSLNMLLMGIILSIMIIL